MALFRIETEDDISHEFLTYYETKRKLNLGSNTDIRKDFLNIDCLDTIPNLDLEADVEDLFYIPNNSATEILAYDLLEHFSFSITTKVLKNWISKLAPGGKIIVRVPDLERLAEKLLDRSLPVFEVQRLIYGGQDYMSNFHFAGFTGGYLEGLMLGCGCSEVIQVVKESESHNVVVVARK